MATSMPAAIPEEERLEQLPWSPREQSARDLPRLMSQGSLRLRSTLASQKSLSNLEGASLLRSGSMKVNVALGGDKDTSESLARRSAIRARLEDLDANHDGVIDKEDLVDFIEKTIATEKRLRTITWVAVCSVIALVVFAGATFGLTYAVVDMTKEAQAARGAWVDRSSFNTLRTAHGGFMEVNYTRSPIPQRAHIPGAQAASADPTADLVADTAGNTDADPTRRLLALDSGHGDGHLHGGVNFDSRAAVRELLATAKPPLGTVARENAETACRWLTEGNINIPLKVLDDFGLHFPAGTATVAEAKGCRDLHASPHSMAEISGTIVYHRTSYVIRCLRGAERCTIRYAPHSGPSTVTPTKKASKGRRLEADSTGGFHSECPPVEVGGALQPVHKLSDGTCPNCFPAAATALLVDGSSRPLSQLAVGDLVQVVEEDGSLGWSEVFLFPHFQAAGAHAFLRISTVANAAITLSADHYLYVAPHEGAAFGQRSALPAADVKAGDLVWRRTGSGSLAIEVVTLVQPVTEEGLVNPFTVRGNIVVNGVAASTYNTAMGSEARMHAFSSIGRGLWRRTPWLLRGVHRARLAQPLSLAIGRFFAKNLQPASSSNPALHWTAVRLSKLSV